MQTKTEQWKVKVGFMDVCTWAEGWGLEIANRGGDEGRAGDEVRNCREGQEMKFGIAGKVGVCSHGFGKNSGQALPFEIGICRIQYELMITRVDTGLNLHPNRIRSSHSHDIELQFSCNKPIDVLGN
ncbi:hypothetical protein NE237_000631 [Protea cynaroides]|uniref:Uncharacterized protein n=1 Tax=Protea cynaroides TaxID=273540 RepID=A0A9Q0QXP0_9MAGN|nr:hypothetical protein NE237_000631 [Protea cynaroides]